MPGVHVGFALRFAGPRIARAVTALAAAFALVAASLTLAGAAHATSAGPPTSSVAGLATHGQDALLNLPLSFVENRGQVDPEVRYHAEVSGAAFFFARDRIVVSIADRPDSRFAVALEFVGARAEVEPHGAGPTGGVVNYLRGDDPAGWQSGLPSFTSIVYPQLWPGIDMVLHAEDGQLKYEFLVRPGARPSDIRLAYDGVEDLTLDGSGGLLIDTAAGDLQDSAPVSYQDVDGARVPVESRFVLGDGADYGFAVGAYDADRDLVIDPALEYSTLLGGSSDEDTHDMAVDGSGNVVVAGMTQSTDFPATTGAVQGSLGGGVMDAFVAKLNADGSGLVYATYLGGTPTPTRRGNTDQTEVARSVAVDGSGNAYVVGQTGSGDFPTTSGAFDTTLGVGEQTATDAFVAKLGPTGNLAYSTFLGGEAGSDDGRQVALDTSGNAFVAGSTFSADFPTTTGAFDTTHNGGEDVYVAKLNSTGSGLVYSTILGGADNELSRGVAVDAAGDAYVSASTRSVDYPSTPDAFQPDHSGGAFAELFEAAVTKINNTGSGLVYSTFLGGAEVDHGGDLTLDSAGNAYTLVGTQSPTFPTTPGAYDTTFDGTSEGAVVKLNAAGSGLVYSTFTDAGAGAITLDDGNNAWLAGGAGAGAPVSANGLQHCGGGDAYIAELNATGSAMDFSTYFGGTGSDGASGIDVDSGGKVYVAGSTLSSDFPTTGSAFDSSFGGDPSIFWGDAFVLRFAAGDAPVGGPGCSTPVLSSLSLDPTSVAGGNSSTGTVTLGAPAPEGGVSVALSSSDTAVATVPGSVTVPAGATSATFTVSTSSVSADTSATISATHGGVTRSQGLAVTAESTSTTETSTFSGQADRNQTVAHTVSVATGTVSVDLDWTESRTDLDLRVRDSSGTLVFSDTGSTRPKTGSFSATTGDYRFEITNTTRRDTEYTLSVTYPAVSSTPAASDTTAPTVSVSSPTDGSTVSGTVTMSASASDDVAVSEVRFFVDGTQIGADTTSSYSTTWDTTTVADGSRVLTARALDAAGNTGTSASVTVTVSNTVSEPEPEPAVAVSTLELSPTSVTGGASSTATVTLTAPAPSGDASVTLSSSNTAVATVPPSVTVPAGATSATFTVSTSAQTADASATISAAFGGVTRTAQLAVTAASATDTVTITRAEYDDGELEVRASSSNSSATLTVYVTATGERIGTLSSGRGVFDWPSNPQNITVRSNLGGEATSSVSSG